MNRRNFFTVIAGAAVTWPLRARGLQAGKVEQLGSDET
jgi:hypothetical protein